MSSVSKDDEAIDPRVKTARHLSRLLAIAIMRAVDWETFTQDLRPDLEHRGALIESLFWKRLNEHELIHFQRRLAENAWAKVPHDLIVREFDELKDDLLEIPFQMVANVSAMKHLYFTRGQRCDSGNKGRVVQMAGQLLSRELTPYLRSNARIVSAVVPGMKPVPRGRQLSDEPTREELEAAVREFRYVKSDDLIENERRYKDFTVVSWAIIDARRRLGAIDLSDTDLYVFEIPDADVRGANFREARIAFAKFERAKAQNADFRGAHLYTATFHSADLTGANFAWAMAQDANFLKARMNGTDLSRANLRGAKFSYLTYEKDGAITHSLANIVWISPEEWDSAILPEDILNDLQERLEGATIESKPAFECLVAMSRAGKEFDPRAFWTGEVAIDGGRELFGKRSFVADAVRLD